MADFSKHLSWKQLKQESSDDGSRSGEVCQITGRGANNEEWTCDRVIKVNGDALGAGSKDLVKVEFGAVGKCFPCISAIELRYVGNIVHSSADTSQRPMV